MANGFDCSTGRPEIVAHVSRRAVTDDNLSDRAVQMNQKVSIERLDQEVIHPQAIEVYKFVAAGKGLKKLGIVQLWQLLKWSQTQRR
ncbi:MAG: hypothetical protein HYX88_01215 [Chloroflexi bacterium]|nr:hypothetical protein [Chloroflexota bacterium]